MRRSDEEIIKAINSLKSKIKELQYKLDYVSLDQRDEYIVRMDRHRYVERLMELEWVMN